MTRGLRLSVEQYRAAQAKTKLAPSKHRNVKTELDGIVFDSKKEAARYAELLMMSKSALIADLKVQPRLRCDVNGEHICYYIADFFYTEKGLPIWEDVKSPHTRKQAVYQLKKKLVHAIFKITILET